MRQITEEMERKGRQKDEINAQQQAKRKEQKKQCDARYRQKKKQQSA